MSKYRGEDVGPTWRDVEDLVRATRETFMVSLDMNVTPPCPIPGSRSYTSWRAVVRVWRRPGTVVPSLTAVGTWGYGGASKTAPAALWLAVSEIYDQLQTEAHDHQRTLDAGDDDAGYDEA